MSYEQISRIAYRLWQERGCPEGSPEIDWLRAEAEFEADVNGVELESVEIASTDGLERVAPSDSESLTEVPTLQSEVAFRPESPASGSSSRRRRSGSML
jgi:hypothetical protein